jgi:hypothetical protein
MYYLMVGWRFGIKRAAYDAFFWNAVTIIVSIKGIQYPKSRTAQN